MCPYLKVKCSYVSSVLQNVTELVIGASWNPQYWELAQYVKFDLVHIFESLAPCLSPIPIPNNVFINFLFQSGTVEKQLNASFADLEISMFNNSSFGGTSHTVCMLKKNYGVHLVVGAYTLHDLSKTAAEIASETPVYINLLKDRVDLFYTDNICAMVQLVEDTFGYTYDDHHRDSSNSPVNRSDQM